MQIKFTKSNILLFCSLVSFLAIGILPQMKSNFLWMLLSAIIAFLIFRKKTNSEDRHKSVSFKNASINLAAFAASLGLGIRFLFGWVDSPKLLQLCFNNTHIKNFILCILTLILYVGVFTVINECLSLLKDFLSRSSLNNPNSTERYVSKKALIIIFITSFLYISICSKSSPIYPFNNWNDVHCFFTVGKSILHGKVMYRDIFEQKGPLLYFMFSAAYLISHTSFLGVYFLEIISCFAFLVISYKLMLLFSDEKVIYTIPILAVFIFTSKAFTHGGSAEQFCLPFAALSYYIGMKAAINNKKPSLLEWLLIGVCSGAILWIKFSLLGFYVGFGLFAIVLYIKNKWFKAFLPSLLSLLLGIVIISIPVLIYFVYNKAVLDLFDVYFLNNLFAYSSYAPGNKIIGIANNLRVGFLSFKTNYVFALFFIALGQIYLICKRKTAFFYNLAVILFAFFLIYSGGRNYVYYSFILTVFTPLFAVFCYEAVCSLQIKSLNLQQLNKNYIKIPAFLVYCTLCALVMFKISPNTYMLKYKKDDLPQYKFDKIISQTKNPTLLNYGFLDDGFYTVSNIVPNCKYFCMLNVPYEDMTNTQKYYVKNGLTDFVVTRENQLNSELSPKYECVAAAKQEFTENFFLTYYLYKRK